MAIIVSVQCIQNKDVELRLNQNAILHQTIKLPDLDVYSYNFLFEVFIE